MRSMADTMGYPGVVNKNAFYLLVPSEPQFPLPLSGTYNDVSTELWGESNKIVHFLAYCVREEQCSYWNCCFHHSPFGYLALRSSPSGD